ncbi:MAG: hypothetical protein IT512_11995 [Rhodocyclaceae bacterium]|nr:hypothetical protein [Rhodocyclaceae bacterium]
MHLGELELRTILMKYLAAERLERFKVQIASNTHDAARYVGDVGRQVPFATAVALTRTAKRLSEMYVAEVDRVFDKPVAFTRRGFGFSPATKATLTSKVLIKSKQAKYLLPQITGGRRGLKSFEKRLGGETGATDYWVPGQGVRLTAAGNLSLSEIKSIAAGLRKSGKYGEVFVGVPRGHANAPFGIWARPKTTGRRVRGAIKPLLIRIQTPNYSKRFDFHGFAEKHAGRIFDEEFSRAWRDAVRKVRPITRRVKVIWAHRGKSF